MHECIPLKKYKGKILLKNHQQNKVKYEVKTNLTEITGKPEITIQPHESYEYEYEIYCLHLGNKQGKVIFTQKP